MKDFTYYALHDLPSDTPAPEVCDLLLQHRAPGLPVNTGSDPFGVAVLIDSDAIRSRSDLHRMLTQLIAVIAADPGLELLEG